MPPSLSVCALVRAPAPRVAALVRLYREVADEVVLAVDDRADPDVAAAASAAGARVFLYPFAPPVDRPRAWLHAQCGGDWVMSVDADEVPSAALLEALPRLLEARDATHFWIPRRWLWPDEATYLDEQPWRPDYQLRIVANDPRLVRFFGETHRPLEAVGPGRYLEEPLYHADCVLESRERRAAKAAAYERLLPGKRVAGGAISHVYYLPERRPDARTAPVPEEDAALVSRVLRATDAPAGGGEPAVRVPREEVDRHWPGRPLEDADYRAEIELRQDLHGVVAGEQRTVEARIANRGSATWPWGELGRPEIRASYAWRDGAGEPVEVEALRTPLPVDLAPGESAVLPVHVVAPGAAGSYALEVDLVHEHVRWFGCGARLEVEVEPPLRVLVAGAGEPLEDALALLADAAPELEQVVAERPGPPLPAAYAQERAPSLDAYLLEDTRGSRVLALPRLALRTLALVRAARRLRAGGDPGSLPRGADGFVRAAASSRLLVLVPGGEPDTRGLWATTAAALTGRAAGAAVAVDPAAAAPVEGALDRLLVRALRRRAEPDGPAAAAAAAARRPRPRAAAGGAAPSGRSDSRRGG